MRWAVPTDAEWLKILSTKISDQIAYAAPWESRYRNEHVLYPVAREYAEVFGWDRVNEAMHTGGIKPPKTGAARIVVDALVSRLTVIDASSEDEDAARLVWKAWEDSDLDVMYREGHREALIKGCSFAMVTRAVDDRSKAIVSVEAADQMAVHREPGPPYDVDAALKVSVDEWTGKKVARLMLPGREVS